MKRNANIKSEFTADQKTADPSITTHFDPKRVVVGMSGGVDSSVSAWLLQQAGYTVIGATLRLHDRAEKAVADAAAVCRSLGIPHQVLDQRDLFDRAVLEPFVTDYLNGRTPNPCIFCNPVLKFRALLDLADREEAGSIATGHYVRVVRHPSTKRLAIARAPDGQKDQSYFLYRLTQEQLGRLVLPLADLEKPQVRALARTAGLTISGNRLSADQPDSQDICFIESDYVTFLRDYAGQHKEWQERVDRMGRPGTVVGVDGQSIGNHFGLFNYTVGQRKGFETRSIDRLYVQSADPETNTLVVGAKEQVAADQFIIENLVYSGLGSVDPAVRLNCRIRNTASAVTSHVMPLSSGRFQVILDSPVHAPAAGQSAVFYDGDIIAFGGIITNAAGAVEADQITD